MGFPVGSSELFFPRLFLNVVYLLGFIRSAICCLLGCVGMGQFLEPETTSLPNQMDGLEVMSAAAARTSERLQVVTFSILAEEEEDVMCAVCLNELNGEEEIRGLSNCGHIFHRGCLDKWLHYEHSTCPLCRSPILSEGENDEEQLRTTVDRSSILTGDDSSV